ncbi:MAG: hypothetical protein LC731_07205, partial [Acidobacteria bacterium]|nr:hypothetical protein [Acidobacteriota bacterium]
LVSGPDGSIYIGQALGFGNRIRRVGPDGTITTYAGGGNPSSGNGDGGPATQASLNLNTGTDLGIDEAGNLYITERQRGVVRRVGVDGIITTVAGTGVTGFSGDGGPATQAQLRLPAGLDVGPDGSLYIADVTDHRIRRVAPPLPGFTASDIAIPSEDGSQLYQFNKQGRHLRTLNALTGAILYEFSYDSEGRFTKVHDTEGNVTIIERDAAGKPTAIVAPFGQRTTLGLDINGYINSIADPLNHAYQMAYTADALLTAFTDPRGNASQMTYDADGFLKKDTNAAGGFTALARVETFNSYTVTETSALNRVETRQVTNLSTGEERRVNTDTNGLLTTILRGTDEKSTTTTPDGTITTAVEGPDPRFGMRAPFNKSLNIKTPGGLNFNRTVTRTVSLSDPANALSLTSQTTTTSINGRNFNSAYTASSRTFTFTSLLNRQSTTIIDNLGRPTQMQSANLNPSSFNYDARGRLINVTGGAGAEARTVALSYKAEGFLSSVTDPL